MFSNQFCTRAWVRLQLYEFSSYLGLWIHMYKMWTEYIILAYWKQTTFKLDTELLSYLDLG